MVTINLKSSTTTETIPIHKNFICHYSPYFSAAFNGNFKEGQIQALDLEDVIPAIFNIFVSWLYTQQITRPTLSRPDINALIEFWLLADRFLVSKLQNQIMKLIQGKGYSGFVVRESFVSVFENSAKGCKLRSFLVDGYLKKLVGCDGWEGTDYSWMPREMLEEVLDGMRSRLPSGTKLIEAKENEFLVDESIERR